MSFVQYISFPKELRPFRLSEIRGRENEFGINYVACECQKEILSVPNPHHWEFGINYVACECQKEILSVPNPYHWEIDILIYNSNKAIFNDCFKNTFVYGFELEPPHDYHCQIGEIIHEGLDDVEMKQELDKASSIRRLLESRKLYNFLHQNLNRGEFVEIYTSWLDGMNFNFDSPTVELSINLENLLTMSIPILPLDNLNLRQKLTIHRVS